MGNKDIEDSLERLDKLTQEEARMASAELLRMTERVDGKVVGVDNRVKSVEGKMQDVRDDVRDIRDDVRDVRDDVQDVRGGVRDVGDRVQDISIRVQGVDGKLDQTNRSLFIQYLIVPTAQTTPQATN
jgi:methyl-accepting chemotaxis protein